MSRLSLPSSERCAVFFRAFHARFDLTLAAIATGMGLDPGSARAGLSRMESGADRWSYERFDQFTSYAASRLGVIPAALSACLLGDAQLDIVDDVLAWRYTRLGSDDSSKLLQRLECRSKFRSHWHVHFRYLPGFVLPDDARHCASEFSFPDKDIIAELYEVFKSIHLRFMLADAPNRMMLNLHPVADALNLLSTKTDAYSAWEYDCWRQTIESLCYDCLTYRHSTILRSDCPIAGPLVDDMAWLIIVDDLVIRCRVGAMVLDDMSLKRLPNLDSNTTFSNVGAMTNSTSWTDITAATRRWLLSIIRGS